MGSCCLHPGPPGRGGCTGHRYRPPVPRPTCGPVTGPSRRRNSAYAAGSRSWRGLRPFAFGFRPWLRLAPVAADGHDDVVDDAVLFGFLSTHEEVALGVPLDLLD